MEGPLIFKEKTRRVEMNGSMVNKIIQSKVLTKKSDMLLSLKKKRLIGKIIPFGVVWLVFG